MTYYIITNSGVAGELSSIEEAENFVKDLIVKDGEDPDEIEIIKGLKLSFKAKVTIA